MTDFEGSHDLRRARIPTNPIRRQDGAGNRLDASPERERERGAAILSTRLLVADASPHVEEMVMTDLHSPLAIQIALHYWTRPERYAWREPEHPDSGAVTEIKHMLADLGLV